MTPIIVRRIVPAVLAVPLVGWSSLGMLINWPVDCDVACAGEGGSLFGTIVFGVVLAAAIAAVVFSLFGKVRLGWLALAFSAAVLVAALVADVLLR